jgi:hypothetical protein
MIHSAPITETIGARFSCRAYAKQPIPEDQRRALGQAADALRTGPLGSALRFRLVVAAEGDSEALKGLGTYGFIRDPGGFIVGAARPGGSYLEDYGFALESLVLLATELGLGTCWLGGSFRRGSFARRIELAPGETLPAVVSSGVIASLEDDWNGTLRRLVSGKRRRAWEELFFDGKLGTPLLRERAGSFARPLEKVRLAPSASNRQPWRVVLDGRAWHFLLERTAGYRGGPAGKLLGLEDLQRVDMGIAMCHFELTAKEMGLPGRWNRRSPAPAAAGRAEYVVSWEG